MIFYSGVLISLFLTPNNKHVKNIHRPTKEENAYDIRKATILYLKSLGNLTMFQLLNQPDSKFYAGFR